MRGNDEMIKIAVLNEDAYEEYPLIDELTLHEVKITHKDHQLLVEEGEEITSWDPQHEWVTKQGERLLCFHNVVRVFQRKEKLWIRESAGDINIKGLETEILVNEQNVYWRDKRKVRVYLNGIRIKEPGFEIHDGDILLLNQCKLVFFKNAIEVEATNEVYTSELPSAIAKTGQFDGFPYYKRSPRVIHRRKAEKIEVLKPPTANTMSKGSLVQMILPPLAMMAMTITVSIVMKRGAYILMSAAGTILTTAFSIQRFFSERRELQNKNARRVHVYEQYLINLRKKIRRLRVEEKETLAYMSPSVEELEQMVAQYDSRIYERTMMDEDFLEVTMGFRRGVSDIEVSYKANELELEKEELNEEAKQIEKDFTEIDQIPVTINLKKAHLGLVGSSANIHEQIKYIIAQSTFFQSYHDLEIIFLHGEAFQEDFSYMRWYPHLHMESINIIAEINNERVRDQVLGSVLEILKSRKLRMEENKDSTTFAPHLLFVIDEPKLIINHAIMEYLSEDALKLGVSIIYTTNQMAKLPEYIKTVAILHNAEEGVLLLNEGERVNTSFRVVSTVQIDLESMARNLAALIHEKGMTSNIPESVTFFDLYKIKHPEELAVLNRWKKNESHKSLAVPIGLREQDNFVDLNLHEKAHGPHGLVAGTTGSGKSEIVQAYILSLAVNFHPYEVGFLLIDYKGGGMANLFRDLPHLLGTITNLDGAESTRAMISIKAELARRQRIFSQNNVNHINGYNQLFKLGKVDEPIPHLFLISDEFAELKKEQPDFMKELVSAARIGRSLGIHLILATQKPSGVVDDQIWTNSKFRLCLKVQNEADSREMLKTPDAASIVLPGRAYLQVGNNEIYELFQSAYSGATYQKNVSEKEEKDNRVYLLNQLGQGMLINQDLSGGMESNQIKDTQLDVVVRHVKEVFEDSGAVMVKRPWLPSLAERIASPYLQDFLEHEQQEPSGELDLTVQLGVADIPTQQAQNEFEVDFLKDGHLAYFSSAGYGKSVFLTTLLLSLFVKNKVANLHTYILDFGSSALISLKEIPHVADYMTFDDTEKIGKFITLITQEMKERKQLFAKAMAQNFEIYNQCTEVKLKALLIVLDNFDVVKEMGLDTENFFTQISRDGAGLGIYFVFTASRSSVIRHALYSNIKIKIAGYNFEASEARNIVGKSDYTIPEKKGRALVKLEEVNLMQIYTPVVFETALDYNEHLRSLVQAIQHSIKEAKAVGIKVLPEEFSYDMVSSYRGERIPEIVLGLDKEEVELVGFNRSENPYLIIGPAKSGKTNAAHLILEQLKDWVKVYLFDSKERDCMSYKKQENVCYIDKADKVSTFKTDIQDLIEERKNQLIDELEEGEQSPKEFYLGLDKYCILANDLEDYNALVQEDGEVGTCIKEAAEVGILIIFIGHSAKLPSRDEMVKFAKTSIYGLVLGDQGGLAPFNVSRSREIPTSVDEGLLFKNGSYRAIKIPKV